MGLGVGLSMASLGNLIVDAVPATKTGVSAGVNTIMRMIGAALGGQVAAAAITGHVVATSELPSESGFTLGFVAAATAMGLALLVAIAVPVSSREYAARPAVSSGQRADAS